MPKAAERNAVPEVFPFASSQPLRKDLYYVNEIHCDEAYDFKPTVQETSHQLDKKINLHCVTLRPSMNELNVLYRHQPERAGAPTRKHSSKTISLFGLHPNESGQIIYNGRSQLIDEGHWIYQKWVFNIAFYEQVNENIFVDNPFTYKYEPFTYKYEDLADLF